MTIDEAIKTADELTPNDYKKELKIRWLSVLDGQIFRDVFKTHDNCQPESFDGYDNSSTDIQLLVPPPYDHDIYTNYLSMMVDSSNQEINRYNRDATSYNSAYMRFEAAYNREHAYAKTGQWKF